MKNRYYKKSTNHSYNGFKESGFVLLNKLGATILGISLK